MFFTKECCTINKITVSTLSPQRLSRFTRDVLILKTFHHLAAVKSSIKKTSTRLRDSEALKKTLIWWRRPLTKVSLLSRRLLLRKISIMLLPSAIILLKNRRYAANIVRPNNNVNNICLETTKRVKQDSFGTALTLNQQALPEHEPEDRVDYENLKSGFIFLSRY